MTHAGVHAHQPIDTLARQVALQLRSRMREARKVNRARAAGLRRVAAHPSEWRQARAETAHQVHDARHDGRFERIVTREHGREDRAERRESKRIERERYGELEQRSRDTSNQSVYGRTPPAERRRLHHRQAHEEAERSMADTRHGARRRAWHAAIEAMQARYGHAEETDKSRLGRLDQAAEGAEERKRRRHAARAVAATATAAAAAAVRSGRVQGEGHAPGRETLGQRLHRGLHEYADGSRTLDGDIRKATKKIGDNVREVRDRAAANTRAAGQAVVETTIKRPATSVAKMLRNAIVGAGQKILGWESKDRDDGMQIGGGADPLAGLAHGRGGKSRTPDPRAATRAAMRAHRGPLTTHGGNVETAERPARTDAGKPDRGRGRDQSPAYAH